MDFTQKILAANGVDRLLDRLFLDYDGEKLSIGNKLIHVKGLFHIPEQALIDLMIRNLDKFQDVDTIFKQYYKNPQCSLAVCRSALADKQMIDIAEAMKKDTKDDESIQDLKSRYYLVTTTENSSIEQKLKYLFYFFGNDIVKNKTLLINGQKLLISTNNKCIVTDQILQMIPISAFTLDVDNCRWSLYYDDTLEIHFLFND